MKAKAYLRDESAVVAVSGRLDAMTAPEFERGCADYSAGRLVLDLSDLEYISSAGLRSILTLAKRLKASGGTLALCGLNGLVQEVFTVSGFDNFLPVFADLDLACAAS